MYLRPTILLHTHTADSVMTFYFISNEMKNIKVTRVGVLKLLLNIIENNFSGPIDSVGRPRSCPGSIHTNSISRSRPVIVKIL